MGLNNIKMIFNNKNKILTNAVSNYFTVGWIGIWGLILLPIYLKVLGPSEWGIVAICLTFQSLMFLLDLGLGQLMPRDIAKAGSNKTEQYKKYKTFFRLYLLIGLVAFLVGNLVVNKLIINWFNISSENIQFAEYCLRLVLLQFVFQFVNNVNIGYWFGIQNQTKSNLRQVIFFSLKHIGALLLIFLWEKNAFSYQFSFASITMIEFIYNYCSIKKEFNCIDRVKVYWNEINIILKESGAFSIAVILGLCITQIDRIILSKAVSIEIFGYYVIICNLGAAFLQLQYPLTRAYLPKLVASSLADRQLLIKSLLRMIIIFCIVPALITCIFAPFILELWLHNKVAVELGSLPLRLILLAVCINSLYNIVYQLIFIKGDGGFILLTNIVVFIIVLPLTLYMSYSIGLVAGGIAWLSTSIIQFIFSFFWYKRNKISYTNSHWGGN